MGMPKKCSQRQILTELSREGTSAGRQFAFETANSSVDQRPCDDQAMRNCVCASFSQLRMETGLPLVWKKCMNADTIPLIRIALSGRLLAHEG